MFIRLEAKIIYINKGTFFVDLEKKTMYYINIFTYIDITLLYNKTYNFEVGNESKLFAITLFLLVFFFYPEPMSILEIYSLVIVFVNNRQSMTLWLNFPFPRKYLFCGGQGACLVDIKKLSGN